MPLLRSPRANSAGGPRGARRRLVVAVVVLAGLLRVGTLAAEAPGLGLDVTVLEKAGVYSVLARFFVPHPPDAVRAVLTDYEDIPKFMPQIETSLVLERAPGHAVVRQEANSRFMLFSKRVYLVLDVTEDPEHIVFQDVSQRSFSRYEGSWCLSAEEGGTDVLYQLVADPSFDVPGFILKRLLQRDSAETIRQLREEIATRAQRPLVDRQPID